MTAPFTPAQRDDCHVAILKWMAGDPLTAPEQAALDTALAFNKIDQLQQIYTETAMSAKHQMPQEPGYYWAKWRIAAEGTVEGDELTPSDDWEIVQVNWNILGWEDQTDEENPERLSVSVCGVQQCQWREDFFWGARVAGLKAGAVE